MAVAEDRRGEKVEQRVHDNNTVAEMYKYGGAFALIGLEFFYQRKEGGPPIEIRLDGLHRDGETYRAADVETEKPMEDSFHPRELTVGKGTRGRRDPVILLMRQLKMNNFEQYLDPLVEEQPVRQADFHTPESQFGLHAEERRVSENPQNEGQARGMRGGFLPATIGRGRSGTPIPRAQMTPPQRRVATPFRPQFEQAYQPMFRHASPANYHPHMHERMGAADPF
jgi:hypothetical protein